MKPVVSIGLPVRNGEKYLKRSLLSIINQTEQNIEIIVSDNNSTDNTQLILKEFKKKDNRIKVFRQKKPLVVIDNFKFVLSKAKAKYFMWAAHDDTRSLNYIEVVLKNLKSSNDSILAFSDMFEIPVDKHKVKKKLYYPFSTTRLNKWQRVKKTAFLQPYCIYGLWVTDKLRSLPFLHCVWWFDLPLMMSAAYKGHFLYVPGANFNYFEIKKTSKERASSDNYIKNFNIIYGVYDLLLKTIITGYLTGGIKLAFYSFCLVFVKQIRNVPGFIYRRFFKW